MPNEFRGFLNVLNTELRVSPYKYVEEVAQQIVDEAIQILDTQKYNWQPLQEDYLNKKIRVGRDPRILIATGFYQDHISWGHRADGTVWVGVEDVIHPDADLPLVVLARIHEFGTSTIPARPLWRPLLSKYMRSNEKFAARYRKEVERAFLKAKELNFQRIKVKVDR